MRSVLQSYRTVEATKGEKYEGEKKEVYLFGGMSGACSLRDGRARYRRRKRGIEINLAAAQLNLDDSSLLIHNKGSNQKKKTGKKRSG